MYSMARKLQSMHTYVKDRKLGHKLALSPERLAFKAMYLGLKINDALKITALIIHPNSDRVIDDFVPSMKGLEALRNLPHPLFTDPVGLVYTPSYNKKQVTVPTTVPTTGC